MKVNVMPVAPQFVPQIRSFVREPGHTLAADPDILHVSNGQAHSLGLGLTLVSIPGLVQDVGGVAPEASSKVFEKVWEAVKPVLPDHDPVGSGIKAVVAGMVFWERITADEHATTTRVVLDGAKLGREVYGLLTDLFPQLKAVDPYISPVGVIVSIADKAYAIYLKQEAA